MTPFAVAIVSYNSREHLRACLATVQSEAPNEVVVVDNASSDGSIEMVQNDYPWVVLCANKANRGYGAAANQGIAHCTETYVLLLNSDTRLHPGALRALASFFDSHPHAAIVGPRLVNPDGTLQSSCYPFPTPLNTLLGNTILDGLIRSTPVLRKQYLPAWPHNAERAVPWVKGAALAVRREAFEAVGGFDESFFMYFEETDLCYRLRAAGGQVYFAPVTTVVHIGGVSTTQFRTGMAVQFFASLKQFYERHYSRLRLIELVVIVKSIMLVRLLIDSTRLYVTGDSGKCAALAADIGAWKDVLMKHWRSQVTHSS